MNRSFLFHKNASYFLFLGLIFTFTGICLSNTSKAKEMRVDLHPAWDSRTHTHVCINGVENGSRHVYVADLSAFVPSVEG